VTADRTIERRDRVRARPAAIPAGRALVVPLALTLLLVVAVVIRILVSRRFPAPWILGDELHYSELAKSFAADGAMRLREEPSPVRTIYPVLVSPAWLADSTATAYAIAKALNVGLMTLAAVPFFLWARRLVRPAYALVATLLFLLLPTGLYANLIMTESAFLPAFLTSMLLVALALERPTVLRQIVAVVALGLPVAIRAQGVVIVPILLTAIALKVLLDVRAEGRLTFRSLRQGLRPYALALGLVAGAGLAYAGLKIAQGKALHTGLNAYAGVAQVEYSLGDVARWAVWHLAELVFAVGVIPASALVVVAGVAWAAPRASGPAERAFVAISLGAVFWMVLVVGAYASRFSLRIEERNMFYVEPLLLLALVVWLDRGLPRPPRLTAAAIVAPAALLLTLPFERLFNLSLIADTSGLIPLFRVTARLASGIDGMRVLLGLGVLAVGLFFALIPRRSGSVLAPVGVAVFLALSSYSVLNAWAGQSRAAHAAQLTNDTRWIDHAIGAEADAAFLFTPDFQVDPHPLWQANFWNRSVRRVFLLDGLDPNGYPAVATTLDDAGRIVPTAPGTRLPNYVVAAPAVDVAGRVVARTPRLLLYRVRPPLRLAGRAEGIAPDGWTGAEAAYSSFGRGTVRVEVSRPSWVLSVPATVTIVAGPIAVDAAGKPTIGRVTQRRVLRIQAGDQVALDVPATTSLRVELQVTPLITLPDARQIGVEAVFSTVPR
jgi:hypothetical protein